MSRTYKDTPSKVLHESWDTDYIWLVGYGYRLSKTTKPKKRKELDTEDHWMSTPGWWIKMTMNRPERRGAHLLEKKALRILDIEDVDFPNLGRKPHIYFW